MKLTQKIIEKIISEVVGEDVLPLVILLRSKSNISEFDIATKIKIPVDITRNQLYRLYNNNLVSFIRKKDKKKGWYIYYWSLKAERIRYLVTDLKRKRIKKLKERLEREESNHFFSCTNNCIRVDFEQATNFEYRCPECGELLNQEDNTEKRRLILDEMNDLIKTLKVIESAEEALLEKENKQNEEKEIEASNKKPKKTTKAKKKSKKTAKKIKGKK